jgi:Ca2+-binding EF-hand superfamily protein
MANKVLITALVAGVALTTGALTGIGAAFAGPDHGRGDGHGGRSHDRMLEKLDTDKDGAVSKAEFEAKRNADFTAADTNKDGNVSAAELSAFHEKKMAERKAEREKRMYDRLDANKDGKVTKGEFEGAGMFDRMDTNKDGKIAADEMMAHGKGSHRGHGGPDDADGQDMPPAE